MTTIKELITASGALRHVLVSAEIDALLDRLLVKEPVDPDVPMQMRHGSVTITGDAAKSPIPGFGLTLQAPTDVIEPAPYKLQFDAARDATRFQFWLVLSHQGQARIVFDIIDAVPGMALTQAAIVPEPGGGVRLEPKPGHPAKLISVSPDGAQSGPALLISGDAGTPAGMKFTADTDSSEGGIVQVAFDSPAVTFGTSSIGFACPAFTLDDSDTLHAEEPDAPGVVLPQPLIDAYKDGWKGFLAREFDFYLPPQVPFFGGEPIKGYFALPTGEGAPQLVIETDVPAREAAGGAAARPGYRLRIECLDPTATGLGGLLPSLITAAMDIPLDGSEPDLPGLGTVAFAAGKPLRLTATLARDPVNAAGDFRITVSLGAQGGEGLVSVAAAGQLAPHAFNIAAMTATALVADGAATPEPGVGDTALLLTKLALAGEALSGMFEPRSKFVLNAVEIESAGDVLPVGGKITLTLDYSVQATVKHLGISGNFGVGMSSANPMRIRVRKARMSVDPRKSGLDMIGLDFDHAEMEVENPGAWDVTGLEDLFDVIGSRSGRGSTWVEVDLRFKLNLGPVRVSGVTLRATLVDGTPEVSISGMAVALDVPGVLDGEGRLRIIEKGFAASIRANVVPLAIAAEATVIYAEPMVVLRLAIDLPAPVPLANTGFGLLGAGGLFGVAARPNYQNPPGTGPGPAPDDPLLRQLYWRPVDERSFVARTGETTFGIEAAVGTLPDLGFSFSAKAGVMITVPDVAIRGSINGKLMSPPVKLSDPGYTPDAIGVSFLGYIGLDSSALTFAVIGSVNLRPLLEIRLPLAGRFPFGNDADDWYTYLGADGYEHQGRGIGPIAAVVLPDLLGISAEAYFMLRGRGIENWPHGRDVPVLYSLSDGFVLAFGFALEASFGAKPIAWAELHASLDLLIGAKPPTLAGFGAAGGSLNLGPFSLGVDARISFMAQSDTSYFWAEVTGRIELLFFDVEGTVTISFGEPFTPAVPKPDRHPLDLLGPAHDPADPPVVIGSTPVLTDDSYRVVARLVEHPDQIAPDMHVWPDTLISIPFAIAPHVVNDAANQFDFVEGPDQPLPAARIGSEMLRYEWTLDELGLFDVTEAENKFDGGERFGADAGPAHLPARWQVSRGGGDDLQELVLLSLTADLWVNRRSDAGTGLPHDPLRLSSDFCNRKVVAEPGWAVGLLASMARPGFYLPPDPVSLDRRKSRVAARMHHFARDEETWQLHPLDEAVLLPTGFSLNPAEITRWDDVAEFEHRRFGGHILAPRLDWRDRERFGIPGGTGYSEQVLQLDLEEAITHGVLLVLGDPRIFEHAEHFDGVIVESGGQAWSKADRQEWRELLPGLVVVAFRQREGEPPAGQVTISYRLGADLGVIGIGGITVGASAHAERENRQTERLKDALGQAAGAPPPTDPGDLGTRHRTILQPGRLYRLDVGMKWQGWLSRQDEAGHVSAVDDNPPLMNTYRRNGEENATTRRQLFFRTAEKSAVPPPSPAETAFSTWLMLKQDTFEPELIERHLTGYEPAQSELFRFTGDPLRAHFAQSHVPALAKAYGFELEVAIRRVDRPGDEYSDPRLFAPLWTYAPSPAFLTPVDRQRFSYAMASPCVRPMPGLCGTVETELEAQAWYEVNVLAVPDAGGVRRGRLPGVSFRTSRWRDPADMFAGLGLSVDGGEGADIITGDLAIATMDLPGGRVAEGDDQAFVAALEAMDLAGWPQAEEPRLSRLWLRREERWLFAGMMLESPEPIHREGRLSIGPGALTLDMAPDGAAIHFGTYRRDALGFRLIYLADAPVDLAGRPAAALVLSADSVRLEISKQVVGRVGLPASPSFAEDP